MIINSSIANLLRFSNIMLLLTLTIILSAIMLFYGMEEKLSMAGLIEGHITVMIMSAFFKLSYVLRLYTRKELGLNK